MLKDHNAVTAVRLEPTTPRSRVEHSTTEPLRSLKNFNRTFHKKIVENQDAASDLGLHCLAMSHKKHKIVNIFLPISFTICFGCSKELSH